MIAPTDARLNLLAGAGAADPASPASPASSSSGEAAKLKKAAGDFESILLASMWKGMKKSFGTPEASEDPAHDTLDDWGIELLSGAVGQAGGLGIGKLLLAHLQPAATPAAGRPAAPGAPVDTAVDAQADLGVKK